MSASFEIHSSAGRYAVALGTGISDGILKESPRAIVLCDRFFEARLRNYGLPVIAVEATEGAKSLDRISEVIVSLREAGAARDSLLIAIGGGVIQDIATFCASIFMRGVPWIYAPTTLLGMVDSCIGGKSSINVGKYKNIVGNFYPPRSVLIDSVFIESLSADKRIAGLCEAAKICFARGDETFRRYLALGPSVDMESDRFVDVIELSLRAKQWFIEIDEFDRKERLLLNFGHTFGHALEGASDFAVTHGVAVGLGMIAAVELARHRGIAATPAARTRELVRHVSELLVAVPALGRALQRVTVDEALDRFASDKKHGTDFFTAIVPNDKGDLERISLPRDGASRRVLAESFASVLAGTLTSVPKTG
jgi:3-dehydroquinate synthase